MLTLGFEINAHYTGIIYVPYLPETIEARKVQKMTVMRKQSISTRPNLVVAANDIVAFIDEDEEAKWAPTTIEYLLRVETLSIPVWY